MIRLVKNYICYESWSISIPSCKILLSILKILEINKPVVINLIVAYQQIVKITSTKFLQQKY